MSKNLMLVVSVAMLACGGDASEGEPGVEVVEDFATIPDDDTLAPGALKLEFPEREVPPQSDTMTCYFLEPTTEDLYVRNVDVYQGKNGHHMIVMRTIMREEPGSMRDCSKAEDMVNVLPVIPAGQGGFDGLPEGMAMKVPKGSQMVLQQHYLNTGDKPLRVHDALVLETVPESAVETQVGFMAVNAGKLALDAKAGEQNVDITCEVPDDDMNVIVLGPHMHEWGKRYAATHTPAGGKPETLLDVDTWEAHYRDAPPYVTFYGTGLVLNAGDRLDVRCTFENTTGAPLEFPQEMCTMYGLFYPARDKSAWVCDP